MVVAVEEGCKWLAVNEQVKGCGVGADSLRGFFFRNKKQGSRSSRYLVK